MLWYHQYNGEMSIPTELQHEYNDVSLLRYPLNGVTESFSRMSFPGMAIYPPECRKYLFPCSASVQVVSFTLVLRGARCSNPYDSGEGLLPWVRDGGKHAECWDEWTELGTPEACWRGNMSIIKWCRLLKGKMHAVGKMTIVLRKQEMCWGSWAAI